MRDYLIDSLTLVGIAALVAAAMLSAMAVLGHPSVPTAMWRP